MLTENRLTPRDFTDSGRLADEKKRIFRTAWHFVGLTRDLPESEDWFLARVAGNEIIVRNSGDGDIRAFVNVCPHRFSALVTAEIGKGRLRCPYHLWSFDREGTPSHVPLRGTLPLEQCQIRSLSLRRWSVGLCGEMIFIAEQPSKSLDAFLGCLAAPLSEMSNGLGRENLRFSQEIAANWKVILQNTIEFDHAFSVHPETFAPMVQRPLTILAHDAPAPHIAYHTVMRQNPDPKPMEKRISNLFARSVIPMKEGYWHACLFPSATIGTTENRVFALITYQPLSPGLTRAEYRLFESKIDGLAPVERAILDSVTPADIAFTRQLLEEDRVICETVQRGLSSAPDDLAGTLMPGETLVAQFQEHWIKAMDRPN